MDKAKIILENGIEKEVSGIFYIYNSKYYFIYTECELDENNYVILHLVQVGKEIKATPEGTIDTGFMVGVEISDFEEWKNVQHSVTQIVNDKKSGVQSSNITYLPISSLSTLKIVNKKTFKLLKNIVEENFGLSFKADNVEVSTLEDNVANVTLEPVLPTLEPVVEQAPSTIEQSLPVVPNVESNTLNTIEVNSLGNVNQAVIDEQNNNVVIDYRTKFFEEQEKNKQLEETISELTQKLNNIKNIIGE